MVAEGRQAPDFELESDTGEPVRLSQFRGRPVVLYFYPRDDTAGCTAQACEFRDDYAEYEQRDAVILGVSPDNVDAHMRFREKYGLPFRLLADPDHRVAELYGAWGEKTSYGKKTVGLIRSTFVIDADGRVLHAMRGVRPQGHSRQVLLALPDEPRL
ncbi:MAG: thioredoxin-dependent thiol peroxidase [Thermoleophilia bacterium]|nr:thioredoxin-dependent thiol peroxidase [Thermoleophilia bacterium]